LRRRTLRRIGGAKNCWAESCWNAARSRLGWRRSGARHCLGKRHKRACNRPRGAMVRSRRTSVRQCPPRLDRCHETRTRTKQAIARPRQREQSALQQPPADAPTDSDF
jgi:hypothetical protein